VAIRRKHGTGSPFVVSPKRLSAQVRVRDLEVRDSGK
jgi:hypothetical protein